MLRKSLGIAIRLFKAEASLLLFLANSSRRLRAGAFQPAALARIDYWEESITKQLQRGIECPCIVAQRSRCCCLRQ